MAVPFTPWRTHFSLANCVKAELSFFLFFSPSCLPTLTLLPPHSRVLLCRILKQSCYNQNQHIPMVSPTQHLSWLLLLLLSTLVPVSVSALPEPGARDNGCAFGYNNTFYILGGWVRKLYL